MRTSHGTIEESTDGTRIVITREVEFGPEDLWDAFTTAEGLAPWVGILRGSRETGDLNFSMVEGGQEANAAKVSIHRCRAPHELAFTTESEYGNWKLGVEIDGTATGSRIRFIHILGAADDPSNIGPGWEYYMERAILSLRGGDVDSVAWDEYYPVLASAYTKAPG